MRKPLKVTREDATGFKKKSVLDSISTSAIDESWKPAKKSRGPVVKAEPPAQTPLEPVSTPVKAGIASDHSAEQQPGEPVDKLTAEPATSTNSSVEKMVRYVAPPAPTKSDNVTVGVRLRVLERHAQQLDSIAENGGDPEAILAMALSLMVRPTYKPTFQPQVLEPSGPGKYSRRTSARIPKNTLDAIISQVEGGDRLPRASLVVGQLEVEWFKALEWAIKRASS